MPTLSQVVEDISGAPDNSPWIFFTPTRESNDGTKLVTPTQVRRYPVNGVLTVSLDPGPAVVSFGGGTYSFTVPNADSDIWPLIEAAVGIPPDTPQQQLEDAVASYLTDHPISGGSGSAAWGAITGTLSSQTDLQSALNNKQVANANLTALAALSAPATKLSGIATAATANDTDANLRARASHTGTQTASTISDFTEAAQDVIGSTIVAGTNVTTAYNDAANTFTINATGAGGGLDAEAVQDAVGAMVVAGSNVSTSYNDAAGTLTISATGGTETGVRDLDSFAGATDDAKLTAALSYAAAQTHIPAIRFPARDVTLNTGGRVPFSGMKLIGPGITNGPKPVDQGSPLVTHVVHVNVGTGTSSLFNSSGTIYGVHVQNLVFQDDAGTSQFWHQPTNTLFASNFHALTFFGFRNIFGNATTKCLMTQNSFTGHWECNAGWDTQFHIGGSDNSFWMDSICNVDSSRAAGSGVYHVMFDFLQKSDIGYIYSTAQNGWKSMLLAGSAPFGCRFFGGTYEGESATANPATASLIDITGGNWTFFGTSFNHVSSSGVNGAITQSGGEVSFYSPVYIRASATAATWPLFYQTGGAAQFITPVCGTSGESIRARWASGATTALSPGGTFRHVTVTPSTGVAGTSASLFLDNLNGQRWEFFNNATGQFGVWDETNGKQPLTFTPNAPADSLKVAANGLVTFATAARSTPYTTAGRPSASTLGAGACIYDVTLSKPIWSNGTTWKDSAGTTV